MSTEHNASSMGEPTEERITLRMQVHMDAPSHGIVLRDGPKPTRVRGRIPRIARLLALAHHFQELLDTGVVRTQMELAELTKLTTARITQIMNLLILAPDIQEEILFLPPVTSGDPPVTEKTLRSVLQTLVWSEQQRNFAPAAATFWYDIGGAPSLVRGWQCCSRGQHHPQDRRRQEARSSRVSSTEINDLKPNPIIGP